MIRIVIVEDEPAIARNLHFMLNEIEKVQLLETIANTEFGAKWFEENTGNYDLVFMDIRLSDGLSFDIFNKTKITAPVIFVTAYDEYALAAFKSNGIDYILKPFDKKDLQVALNKFKTLTKFDASQGNENISHLLKELKQTQYKQSFLVHYREKLIPVATNDIAYFYTTNEVTHAVLHDKRKLIVDFTLEELQQQLNPQNFFRANRQYIVQRSAIKEVEFYFNGRLLLVINPSPEEKVLVSKARASEFKEWMNQ
ncbi:DNA-binding response regulator [Arachidicoccus ginsenosidimutans]|uniref:LytR/AlgR family response regulator transcription factor n=1 Tax=Arachidicoccus sp. BS20 TaxID=1850526 RepID=UPI0007F07526|nr:LytTR family DNA-binding domain-containing protein [Arachidicoccus sp. BS20]ANI88068.1 DNA-binding response regulator [Arachidicoccus sp. BS20]